VDALVAWIAGDYRRWWWRVPVPSGVRCRGSVHLEDGR
jgi:hypothetical protein